MRLGLYLEMKKLNTISGVKGKGATVSIRNVEDFECKSKLREKLGRNFIVTSENNLKFDILFTDEQVKYLSTSC